MCGKAPRRDTGLTLILSRDSNGAVGAHDRVRRCESSTDHSMTVAAQNQRSAYFKAVTFEVAHVAKS